MSRLLGLDIGGTLSRARVCVDGDVVAEAEAGSASLTANGTDGATAALTDLLAQLPLDPNRPFDAVCAGSAGSNVPGAREFLHGRLAPLTKSGTVVIVNDAMLVLPAAGLDAGVGVICGTGSIAVGRWRHREARAGGFGYLLGDEGSGYWIARAALRALLDRRDRGVPLGALGDRLLAAEGVDSIDALHRLFYDQPYPRRWARHAPLVLGSADPAAALITAEAAQALAALVVSTAQRLGAPAGPPVVLAGGLMAHPALRAATERAIGEALPGSDVRVLTEPPVAGAVRLARAAVRLRAARRTASPARRWTEMKTKIIISSDRYSVQPKGDGMSLKVPADLLERAEQGNATDADFIACIQTSLPYAWEVISKLVERTSETGASYADDQTPPPSQEEHGQLLRAMASDSMRNALERHFGVRVAFQNCCRVGVFTAAGSDEAYRDFVSARAQLLNQSPELINC